MPAPFFTLKLRIYQMPDWIFALGKPESLWLTKDNKSEAAYQLTQESFAWVVSRFFALKREFLSGQSDGSTYRAMKPKFLAIKAEAEKLFGSGKVAKLVRYGKDHKGLALVNPKPLGEIIDDNAPPLSAGPAGGVFWLNRNTCAQTAQPVLDAIERIYYSPECQSNEHAVAEFKRRRAEFKASSHYKHLRLRNSLRKRKI